MTEAKRPISAGYYNILKTWPDWSQFFTATEIGGLAYMHLYDMAKCGLLESHPSLLSYRPTQKALEELAYYEQFWQTLQTQDKRLRTNDR
jgi:hypothetical protein